jgi:multiple sugar transport system substrate-binding protein
MNNEENGEWRKYKTCVTVNLFVENWWPFQNFPSLLSRFENITNIRTKLNWYECTTEVIENMRRDTVDSFVSDNPSYDLIWTDPVIIQQYASLGRIEALDDYISSESYSLDDFEPEAVKVGTHGGKIFGLPSCHTSNILMYREDLFKKHKISVPKTMNELKSAALDIRKAEHSRGNKDFYGFASRGGPGWGYIGWIVPSIWAPSWDVKWFDDQGNPAFSTPKHTEALEHFVNLLQKTGPPEIATMDYADVMKHYENGKVAMIMEVGMEYSHFYDKVHPLTEVSKCAVVPCGLHGKNHPGLFAPQFVIPIGSKVKEAAWELAKYLCSTNVQLDSALHSSGVDTSRKSVLFSSRLDKKYKPEFLRVIRETHSIAVEERPFSKHGTKTLDIVGNEYNLCLKGEKSAENALNDAAANILSLGSRW